jgi:glycosyltransferase involved in cell wall biosynthesis
VATLVIVSFRLHGTDGVSIEAAKWARALESLGHEVATVAGEGPVDVVVPGLAIDATGPPSFDELANALGDAELVIVENLASLPLNVAAREVLYRVLDRRKALFHHHDLAWQRDNLSHLDGPRDQDNWHHVTINEVSRHQLRDRGIDAVTIMNTFDCDPVLGNRSAARAALGVRDEIVALVPTRAIARKNIEGALELCRRLGATLWLLGPTEDGYGPELERLIERAETKVLRGMSPGLDIADAYAGCDVVVMASTWEGFGNPVLESVTHRRPLALNPYPVAREISAYGFEFFGLDDVKGITRFIEKPDEGLFKRNLVVAREHFNELHLAQRLEALLESMDIR